MKLNLKQSQVNRLGYFTKRGLVCSQYQQDRGHTLLKERLAVWPALALQGGGEWVGVRKGDAFVFCFFVLLFYVL